MTNRLKYFVFCGFILKSLYLNSQNISLKIQPTEQKSNLSKLSYKDKLNTRSAANKEIENVLTALRQMGYLLASVDSIYGDSTHITAIISQNLVYKTAKISRGNLEPTLAAKIGINQKSFANKNFKYKEIAFKLEQIITYYENNGFPFASAKLDSVQFTDNNMSASINVQKNNFYRLDSFRIIGSARVNKSFLFRYLGIKEKMPYNEELIAAISQKIKQLPFLTETQAQRVQLSNKSNKLLLLLDKKEASQFDGIIGILPDAATKKTIVTGDVKLKLVNGVFRNGETFDLEWRRLKSQTTDFSGRLIYPYLFGTPVGTDYSLKIYRRDTTFIDIHHNIGLQYYFQGLNHVKFFYKQRNNNLISTSSYSFVTTLPEYADILTQSYGVGLFLERLDYRFNPKKGLAINLTGQTGNRTIKQNPQINELAYKDVILKSAQYQFEGSIAWYLNLRKNNVLKLGLQGASIFGNTSIFRNELFRIGGLKTLRGFDEESIFASTFVIPTLEYRFLFSQNSHLLLFAEGAWYENNSNKNYVKDTPLSFGAGVNFDTKAGILSLNYAIGNQFGNGFDIRNGKIHFGLTALF